MLIFTRKAEQAIVIDGETTVRVLSIDGDRVKLGIDAPARIGVLREELIREVAGENRLAALPQRRGSPALLNRLRSLEQASDPKKSTSE